MLESTDCRPKTIPPLFLFFLSSFPALTSPSFPLLRHPLSPPFLFLKPAVLLNTPTNLETKIPKIAFRAFLNILNGRPAIFLAIFALHLLEMVRFPMEADEAADEQLGAVFGGFG